MFVQTPRCLIVPDNTIALSYSFLPFVLFFTQFVHVPGQVVGMEVHGNDIADWCRNTMESLNQQDKETNTMETKWLVMLETEIVPCVDRFFNYTQMMMSS